MRNVLTRPTAAWCVRVLIMGTLLAWPTVARAQEEPSAEPGYRIGPVGLNGRTDITEVGIDSNVFNTAEDPQEDFTLTLVSELEARVRVSRVQFLVGSTGDFVYFKKFAEERAVNHGTEVRVNLALGAFQPYISGAARNTTARSGFEIDARAKRNEKTVTAGLGVRLSPLTSLRFWTRRFETQFAPDEEFRGIELAEELNRTLETASAGIEIEVTPQTKLLMSTEVERAGFNAGNSRAADTIRGIATVQIDPGDALNGEAIVGYRRFKTRQPDVPDYTGLIASGTLTYTMLERMQIEASMVRDVSYSHEPLSPYYLVTGATVTVTHRVLGPLDVQARAGQYRLDYRTIGEGTTSERLDTQSNAGGGIGFRITRKIRLGLNYETVQRKSTTLPEAEYNRSRFFGTFAYGD